MSSGMIGTGCVVVGALAPIPALSGWAKHKPVALYSTKRFARLTCTVQRFPETDLLQYNEKEVGT